MQALASRGLAEADEAEGFKALADLPRTFDDGNGRGVRRGGEVEHQSAGLLGLEWLAVPGVQFHRAGLGRRNQGFDAVEPNSGLADAQDGYLGDQR